MHEEPLAARAVLAAVEVGGLEADLDHLRVVVVVVVVVVAAVAVIGHERRATARGSRVPGGGVQPETT
jgi:hypothetical protein